MNRNTQSDQILRIIRDGGSEGAPNWKLADISLQYNGRIHDLRHNHGHDIRKRRVYKDGRPTETYFYYLVAPQIKNTWSDIHAVYVGLDI